MAANSRRRRFAAALADATPAFTTSPAHGMRSGRWWRFAAALAGAPHVRPPDHTSDDYSPNQTGTRKARSQTKSARQNQYVNHILSLYRAQLLSNPTARLEALVLRNSLTVVARLADVQTILARTINRYGYPRWRVDYRRIPAGAKRSLVARQQNLGRYADQFISVSDLAVAGTIDQKSWDRVILELDDSIDHSVHEDPPVDQLLRLPSPASQPKLFRKVMATTVRETRYRLDAASTALNAAILDSIADLREDCASVGWHLPPVNATVVNPIFTVVVHRLLKTISDVSGADLRSVNLIDLQLTGLRWSSDTRWPGAWAAYIRDNSVQIADDLYEIRPPGSSTDVNAPTHAQ